MPPKKPSPWRPSFFTLSILPGSIGFLLLYFYGLPSLSETPARGARASQWQSSEGEPGIAESRLTAQSVESVQQSDLGPNPKDPKDPYGFYLHVYGDPAAVIYQVREVKKFFPTSPIYVMSDGGLDFSALCAKEGCTFVLCPPANDRWHPWPFFRRLFDAAVSLNTKYVIMLEPDNTVHDYIKRPPPADVGGLLVTGRSFGLVKYVEKMAQKRVPGFKWTSRSMSSGLCGGAYFKREAILDALSDENMMKLDWNYLGEKLSKEIFSSDFAMQYAFAARGWKIEPWDDAAQMDKDKDQPLTGARDASFKHYCSCYPGGKPTYNLKLTKEDAKLYKEGGYEMTSGPYSSSVCQVCYNSTRYLELWGSARCTNELPFQLSEKLLQRHHPELDSKPCDLPWLCKPGKKRGKGIDSSVGFAPVDPLATWAAHGSTSGGPGQLQTVGRADLQLPTRDQDVGICKPVPRCSTEAAEEVGLHRRTLPRGRSPRLRLPCPRRRHLLQRTRRRSDEWEPTFDLSSSTQRIVPRAAMVGAKSLSKRARKRCKEVRDHNENQTPEISEICR